MLNSLVAVCFCLAITIWLCLAATVGAETERPSLQFNKWALTVYGGISTNGGI